MKISDISLKSGELFRDAPISNIGHLFSHESNRMVAIQNKEEMDIALQSDEISGVIIPPELISHIPDHLGVIISDEPRLTVLHILHSLYPNLISGKPYDTIIHPSASIHQSAHIAPSNVKIGKNVRIDEFVKIYSGTEIRDNVRINAHSHIGVPEGGIDLHSPDYKPFGTVLIDEYVFIHAHCMIEISDFPDTTYIGKKCQIDSFTTIMAGASIGSYSLTAGIVSIGSYAIIGDDTWIGPGSTISPGITIGNHCYVTLGSTVQINIGVNKIVKDSWAMDRNKFRGIIP